MLLTLQQLRSDVVVPATDATLFSDDWLWTGRVLLSTTLAACCVCHVNVAVVAYIKQGFQTWGECSQRYVFTLYVSECVNILLISWIIPLASFRLMYDWFENFRWDLQTVCQRAGLFVWAVSSLGALLYTTCWCIPQIPIFHVFTHPHVWTLSSDWGLLFRRIFVSLQCLICRVSGADCPVAALHRVW